MGCTGSRDINRFRLQSGRTGNYTGSISPISSGLSVVVLTGSTEILHLSLVDIILLHRTNPDHICYQLPPVLPFFQPQLSKSLRTSLPTSH